MFKDLKETQDDFKQFKVYSLFYTQGLAMLMNSTLSCYTHKSPQLQILQFKKKFVLYRKKIKAKQNLFLLTILINILFYLIMLKILYVYNIVLLISFILSLAYVNNIILTNVGVQ